MRVSKAAAVAFGIVAISASALAQPVSYAPPPGMQPVTYVQKNDNSDMLAFVLIAALNGATLGLIANDHHDRNVTVIVPPASDF